MPQRRIVVEFDQDPTANAAAITFDTLPPTRNLEQYVIENAVGDIIASITFSPSGILFQLELLDAERQIPDSLR